MRLAVAQTKPVRGNIPANILNHKKLIALAVDKNAEVIVFPELSLTGYEPTLAKKLRTTASDKRLDEFQMISDDHQLVIAAGIPTSKGTDALITLVIFQPEKERTTYSKKYLHADEIPFFVSGENFVSMKMHATDVALAICYEISVLEHTEKAGSSGAGIYIASVAKSVGGIDKAITTLSDTANKYSMITLMANCVGICDGFECAGKSSIWNNKGSLIGQLDSTREGILLIDTTTSQVFSQYL